MSILHHSEIESSGAAQDIVFFLHGILDRGRNWRRFAQELVSQRPHWKAVLVDLRLHGESQGFDPPHTIHACGEDVVTLVRELNKAREQQGSAPSKRVLVGHSFGGKVALEAVRQAPDLFASLWLIDSFSGLSVKQGDAWKMIAWLQRNGGPFVSRAEVTSALKRDDFSA